MDLREMLRRGLEENSYLSQSEDMKRRLEQEQTIGGLLPTDKLRAENKIRDIVRSENEREPPEENNKVLTLETPSLPPSTLGGGSPFPQSTSPTPKIYSGGNPFAAKPQPPTQPSPPALPIPYSPPAPPAPPSPPAPPAPHPPANPSVPPNTLFTNQQSPLEYILKSAYGWS